MSMAKDGNNNTTACCSERIVSGSVKKKGPFFAMQQQGQSVVAHLSMQQPRKPREMMQVLAVTMNV